MVRTDALLVPRLPIAFMNADHEREAALLRDVDAAITAHRAGVGTLDAVMERLSLLAVHTRDHFLREEAMMRQARFPGFPAHKAEHDRVLSDMDAEARIFREGGGAERLSRYLFEVLPAWFGEHVRTVDVATAAFVLEAQSRNPSPTSTPTFTVVLDGS